MATLQKTCTSCGGVSTVAFGQRLIGGELRWSGRETCSACDSIVEFDDYGDIPAELKAAILLDEGEWMLSLDDDSDRLAAMKIIRDRMVVSLSEAKVMLDALRGTRTTLEWIQEGLRDVGVGSVLSKASKVGATEVND